METSTLERMVSAELRIIRSATPGTAAKVNELKHEHALLYKLDEERFRRIVPLALALNVRDGHCKEIPTIA